MPCVSVVPGAAAALSLSLISTRLGPSQDDDYPVQFLWYRMPMTEERALTPPPRAGGGTDCGARDRGERVCVERGGGFSFCEGARSHGDSAHQCRAVGGKLPKIYPSLPFFASQAPVPCETRYCSPAGLPFCVEILRRVRFAHNN